MEIFDLYDSEGNSLDRTSIRGSKLERGEFHKVTHVWIRNAEGNYLIQQRNKKTDRIPYQWATTMGAVVSGERSRYSSSREVFEEIGILIDEENFIHLDTYFVPNSHASFIVDLFLVKANILIKDTVLDKLEVRNVKYASISEIKTMIKNNDFWEYEKVLKADNYFDLIEKS